MNKHLKHLLPAVGVLVLSAVPVYAHHAFSAEYDHNKPMDLKGKVTEVDWRNPHAHFSADVKGSDGKITNWEFELGSPNVLMRQGWNRYTIKKGDVVQVSGWGAKDGSHLVNASTIVLASGQKVSAGSSGDIPQAHQ